MFMEIPNTFKSREDLVDLNPRRISPSFNRHRIIGLLFYLEHPWLWIILKQIQAYVISFVLQLKKQYVSLVPPLS